MVLLELIPPLCKYIRALLHYEDERSGSSDPRLRAVTRRALFCCLCPLCRKATAALRRGDCATAVKHWTKAVALAPGVQAYEAKLTQAQQQLARRQQSEAQRKKQQEEQRERQRQEEEQRRQQQEELWKQQEAEREQRRKVEAEQRAKEEAERRVKEAQEKAQREREKRERQAREKRERERRQAERREQEEREEREEREQQAQQEKATALAEVLGQGVDAHANLHLAIRNVVGADHSYRVMLMMAVTRARFEAEEQCVCENCMMLMDIGVMESCGVSVAEVIRELRRQQQGALQAEREREVKEERERREREQQEQRERERAQREREKEEEEQRARATREQQEQLQRREREQQEGGARQSGQSSQREQQQEQERQAREQQEKEQQEQEREEREQREREQQQREKEWEERRETWRREQEQREAEQWWKEGGFGKPGNYEVGSGVIPGLVWVKEQLWRCGGYPVTAEGSFVMGWHSWLGLLVVLPIALLNILEFVSEVSGRVRGQGQGVPLTFGCSSP